MPPKFDPNEVKIGKIQKRVMCMFLFVIILRVTYK